MSQTCSPESVGEQDELSFCQPMFSHKTLDIVGTGSIMELSYIIMVTKIKWQK